MDQLNSILEDIRHGSGLAASLDEAARPRPLPGDKTPKDIVALFRVLAKFGFKKPRPKREVRYPGSAHQYTMVSAMVYKGNMRKGNSFTSSQIWEIRKAIKEWATAHGWTHSQQPRKMRGEETDSFGKMQPKIPSHKVANEAGVTMRTSAWNMGTKEPRDANGNPMQDVYFSYSYAMK